MEGQTNQCYLRRKSQKLRAEFSCHKSVNRPVESVTLLSNLTNLAEFTSAHLSISEPLVRKIYASHLLSCQGPETNCGPRRCRHGISTVMYCLLNQSLRRQRPLESHMKSNISSGTLEGHVWWTTVKLNLFYTQRKHKEYFYILYEDLKRPELSFVMLCFVQLLWKIKEKRPYKMQI